MTRYDPFTYGEVPLDSKQQKDAAPDAEDLLFAAGEEVKQAPPADSSWQLLDEDVDGLLPGASPNASETIEFGAEVLGEDTTADIPMSDPMTGGAAMSLEDLDAATPPSPGEMDLALQPELQPPAEQPQLSAEPAAEAHAPEPPQPDMPQPDEPQPDGPAGAAPKQGREVRRRPLSVRARRDAAEADAEPSRKERFAAVPPGRRMPVLAAMAPITVCAAGGTAASWFWVMQGNPVMAGILGATTLVSALFAWLLLRG